MFLTRCNGLNISHNPHRNQLQSVDSQIVLGQKKNELTHLQSGHPRNPKVRRSIQLQPLWNLKNQITLRFGVLCKSPFVLIQPPMYAHGDFISHFSVYFEIGTEGDDRSGKVAAYDRFGVTDAECVFPVCGVLVVQLGVEFGASWD